MSIQNVVLDFDGTLTDTDAEAVNCIKKWNELLAHDLQIPVAKLEEELAQHKATVLADPAAGWEYQGFIVAPACADPYVFHTTLVQKIVSARRPVSATFSESDRSKWMTGLFHQAYPFASIAFRPDAKEFLAQLTEQYDVTIVTNSKTDAVERKLAQLTAPPIKIRGNAKKYVVDPTATSIPESIALEGLPRPVLLRRKSYHEILCGFDPMHSAVVGDIFELDHSLPEYMGFRTIQLETAGTPEYERRRSAHSGPTRLAKNYSEILTQLQK